MSRAIQKPSSLPGLQSRISTASDYFRLGIPRHPIYEWGVLSGKTVVIDPKPVGNTDGEIILPFWIQESTDPKPVAKLVQDAWMLDLDATAVDLTAFTTGLVDGIARANGRTYLLWGFVDSQLDFKGLAATRKPFSSFTAISGGSAAKGATAKTFTVTNAFQFTIGARVVVRNAVGTSPDFEWNWATVVDITSNTALVVDMDNVSAYGSAITGVTSGVIEQWDMFRPWVVATTGQTLYQPYYTLLGEIYTDATSGDITRVYHVDDPYRGFTRVANWPISQTSAITAADKSLGRNIPLWAQKGGFRMFANSATVNHTQTITGADGALYLIRIQVSNQSVEESVSDVRFKQYAVVNIAATATANNITEAQNYYVAGGMRV